MAPPRTRPSTQSNPTAAHRPLTVNSLDRASNHDRSRIAFGRPRKSLPPVVTSGGWTATTSTASSTRHGTAFNTKLAPNVLRKGGEKLKDLFVKVLPASQSGSGILRKDRSLEKDDIIDDEEIDSTYVSPSSRMVVRGASNRQRLADLLPAPAIEAPAHRGGLVMEKDIPPPVSPLALPESWLQAEPFRITDPLGTASPLLSAPANLKVPSLRRIPSFRAGNTGSNSDSSVAEKAPILSPAGIAARLHWKLALKAVENLMKATSIFRIGTNSNYIAMGFDDPPAKRETVVKPKCHFLLAKTAALRTQADFSTLDPHLVKLSSALAAFTPAQRKQLYLGTLTYETHDKGTMLLRDGGTAESVYFLLSGSAEMYKTHKGVNLQQGIFVPGDCIGGVGADEVKSYITEGGGRRRFNVILLETCELLRVDLDEYVRTVFGHDGSNTDMIVGLLNGLPHFQATLETILLKAAQNCSLYRYTPGEIILAAGDLADRIFIVCKGEARATRKIPSPDYIGADEEVSLGVLKAGESFPRLVLPTGMSYDPNRPKRSDFWPKKTAVSVESSSTDDPDAESSSSFCPSIPQVTANMVVTASTAVQCVVFDTLTFLKLATNEMVEMVHEAGLRFATDSGDRGFGGGRGAQFGARSGTLERTRTGLGGFVGPGRTVAA
ncbi:hypothetical protein HKX48_006513 [Thoreauomyces humboldtii]|nr:hypothetical protein HKX48_006513 [Thoreauomyces humboldtii]